jgi:transposase
MADAHASVVDLSRLDREALEALVLAQQEKLLTRYSEIEHLKLIIAKLRRMMFGTKSEKIAREVEQLELKLEELKRPLISGLETTLMNLALVPPL